MSDPATRFYTEIPVFDDFAKVVDDRVYRQMPEDWFIGLTDVIGSTRAIESGQYKAVNMAGAAAISAVINALGHQDFPFAFGGDGVSFAVPGLPPASEPQQMTVPMTGLSARSSNSSRQAGAGATRLPNRGRISAGRPRGLISKRGRPRLGVPAAEKSSKLR